MGVNIFWVSTFFGDQHFRRSKFVGGPLSMAIVQSRIYCIKVQSLTKWRKEVFKENHLSKITRCNSFSFFHNRGGGGLTIFPFLWIYLIFILGQIDLMNNYMLHIWYGFGEYLVNIRYIFEYWAPNIHYFNMNILFHCCEFIWYSYSVKL